MTNLSIRRSVGCMRMLLIVWLAGLAVELRAQEVERESGMPDDQQLMAHPIDSILPEEESEPTDRLGILSVPTENRRVYARFLSTGIRQVERQKEGEVIGLTLEEIQECLKETEGKKIPWGALGLNDREVPQSSSQVYQQMVRSTLMVGTIYDCGRCEKLHANIAGGVVISKDGLALTNHHVLEREESGVETLMAMTSDGVPRPILEVLACNEKADVALIRLGGETPFHPAPLASHVPTPAQHVRVLSHPRNEYFVLTEGEVSRYVSFHSRRSSTMWMEITAPFGGGSSGSGIFNDQGEVVGLVSRIHPLYRTPASGPGRPTDGDADDEPSGRSNRPAPYVEMILRRCVPLQSISECFEQELSPHRGPDKQDAAGKK